MKKTTRIIRQGIAVAAFWVKASVLPMAMEDPEMNKAIKVFSLQDTVYYMRPHLTEENRLKGLISAYATCKFLYSKWEDSDFWQVNHPEYLNEEKRKVLNDNPSLKRLLWLIEPEITELMKIKMEFVSPYEGKYGVNRKRKPIDPLTESEDDIYLRLDLDRITKRYEIKICNHLSFEDLYHKLKYVRGVEQKFDPRKVNIMSTYLSLNVMSSLWIAEGTFLALLDCHIKTNKTPFKKSMEHTTNYLYPYYTDYFLKHNRGPNERKLSIHNFDEYWSKLPYHLFLLQNPQIGFFFTICARNKFVINVYKTESEEKICEYEHDKFIKETDNDPFLTADCSILNDKIFELCDRRKDCFERALQYNIPYSKEFYELEVEIDEFGHKNDYGIAIGGDNLSGLTKPQ